MKALFRPVWHRQELLVRCVRINIAKKNLATLNSVEIDDLGNVSNTFLHDNSTKQNAERKKRAALLLGVSLTPRGRPGPDEGEIQPLPTFPTSEESVKSLKTIEGIAVDELDAIGYRLEGQEIRPIGRKKTVPASH
jgi:hypothetical protein